MNAQVKVALAEHDAWKAQSNILKFYEEFQLHVSVATAQYVPSTYRYGDH